MFTILLLVGALLASQPRGDSAPVAPPELGKPTLVRPGGDGMGKGTTPIALPGLGQPGLDDSADEPQRVAEAYLRALDGSGAGSAREYLLGGTTLTAESYTIPNWKIVKRDAVQIENADLRDAVAEMRTLDATGRKALGTMLQLSGTADDKGDSRAAASQLATPAQSVAERFKQRFPLFAFVARVDKQVYWHPKNPWRVLLAKLGNSGKYTLELHVFTIEETQRRGTSRTWPLRVLRMQTDRYDSDYKVLPASDWDPEG